MFLWNNLVTDNVRMDSEDLNALVRKHIGGVISAAPSKAVSQLSSDVTELLSRGMVTLNAKLTGLEDEKLIIRVIETWGFFWDQVLTYIEGVRPPRPLPSPPTLNPPQSLLPMQTDPLLHSLSRKARRPSSPSGAQAPPGTGALDSPPQLDVRSIALRAFRDRVLLPVSKALASVFAAPRHEWLAARTEYEQSRLQQMCFPPSPPPLSPTSC